jgi:uncharacterized protein (TIGR00369 family)
MTDDRPHLEDPKELPGAFRELTDYKLVRWDDDEAEVVLTVARQHLNRSGTLHGGMLGTIIDAACGYSGVWSPEGEPARSAVTLQLSLQFIAAAEEGQTLTARARRTGGGKTIFFATCEVTDASGRVIGRGDGAFKYRRGQKPNAW